MLALAGADSEASGILTLRERLRLKDSAILEQKIPKESLIRVPKPAGETE